MATLDACTAEAESYGYRAACSVDAQSVVCLMMLALNDLADKISLAQQETEYRMSQYETVQEN